MIAHLTKYLKILNNYCKNNLVKIYYLKEKSENLLSPKILVFLNQFINKVFKT
jgi:hypothetical protein